MRKRIGLVLGTVLVVAFAPVAVAESSSWQPQSVPVDGPLTAVTMAPDDSTAAWAFGTNRDGATVAVRTRGEFAEEWAPASVPDVGRVHGARDGWVVADRGALRWVEGAWRPVPVPTRPGVKTVLRTVTTDPLTENRAWAVGQETIPGTPWRRGVLQRWDGGHWRPVPVPSALLDSSSEFTGVLPWADGAIAVGVDHNHLGDRALVLRFDGSAWTSIPVPHRFGHDEHIADLNAVSGSRLVGWTAPLGAPRSARRPLVFQLDADAGTVTRDRVPQVAAELTSATSEYGTPIAVGVTAQDRPFVLRLVDPSESRWVADEMPNIQGRLVAVSGIIVPNIWAVGVTPTGRPLVLRDSP